MFKFYQHWKHTIISVSVFSRTIELSVQYAVHCYTVLMHSLEISGSFLTEKHRTDMQAACIKHFGVMIIQSPWRTDQWSLLLKACTWIAQIQIKIHPRNPSKKANINVSLIHLRCASACYGCIKQQTHEFVCLLIIYP